MKMESTSVKNSRRVPFSDIRRRSGLGVRSAMNICRPLELSNLGPRRFARLCKTQD